MKRNLFCDYYGEFCENDRCKKGLCMAEAEDKSQELGRQTVQEIAREAALADHARAAAVAVLRLKRLALTEANIRTLARHPAIRTEAERRQLTAEQRPPIELEVLRRLRIAPAKSGPSGKRQ